MQINKIGINIKQPKFQANYFRVDKFGRHCQFMTISTDNEENLGKEPVLQYEQDGKKKDIVEIIISNFYFVDVKADASTSQKATRLEPEIEPEEPDDYDEVMQEPDLDPET